MIKKIRNIGNSKGIILDKALLELLKLEDGDNVEIIPQENGLLIRKPSVDDAYKFISERHKDSLDKLGE